MSVGHPHSGQAGALSENFFPHSGHTIKAIKHQPFCVKFSTAIFIACGTPCIFRYFVKILYKLYISKNDKSIVFCVKCCKKPSLYRKGVENRRQMRWSVTIIISRFERLEYTAHKIKNHSDFSEWFRGDPSEIRTPDTLIKSEWCVPHHSRVL